ncbi:M20 metallopeptidase family protein [[Mycoplasma] testudinis]|uniref:M20 metallopeptidase family protein n=1 Tax=[Mycoplasma] testudinis TaxID=33924 RepID=UPI00048036CA|nr:amidohydrolase [[Mycoplasma] testudinis]
MKILNTIRKSEGEWLAKVRHEFHQIPEIGLNEHNTTKKIINYMKSFGYEIDTSIYKTGLVATLKNGKGKTVGIRADIDGLPIEEKTGLAYASTNGAMHACGHDGHITMAIGAAKYLAKTKKFNGNVKFIFQPAEEAFNGAKKLIQNGLFKKHHFDNIVGLHGMPTCLMKPETKDYAIAFLHEPNKALMASVDAFSVKFIGQGGHSSAPENSIDPIPAALEFSQSIYLIRERIVPSVNRTVLSVCQIAAGSAHNVIPNEVIIQGSLRTQDEQIRKLFMEKIRQFAKLTANKWNLKFVFQSEGLPPLVSDPTINDKAIKIAREYLGPENVFDAVQLMGSEDFPLYGKHVPTAFGLVNTGNQEIVHNPKYDFADKALPTGVSFFIGYVEKTLK